MIKCLHVLHFRTSEFRTSLGTLFCFDHAEYCLYLYISDHRLFTMDSAIQSSPSGSSTMLLHLHICPPPLI